MATNSPLRRARRERMIAGVLAGFARHFGLDVSLLRIVFAVATIFTVGTGALIYLMCWIVIPEGDLGESSATVDGQRLDR